jgi:hypothetical protein
VVRDRIEINSGWEQELRTELGLRGIARGTTLCLIAREIVHQANYHLRLAGYRIVIEADTYDRRGGSVDTTEINASGSTPRRSPCWRGSLCGGALSPTACAALTAIRARPASRGRTPKVRSSMASRCA